MIAVVIGGIGGIGGIETLAGGPLGATLLVMLKEYKQRQRESPP